MIQLESVAATHVQSREVEIVMVPAPPTGPKLSGSAVAVTSHLLSGPTGEDEVEDDAQAVHERPSTNAAIADRRTNWFARKRSARIPAQLSLQT